MDSNKKLTIIRLVIFYILAFLPILTVTLIQVNAYGADLWVSEKEEVMFAMSFTGILGMFAPSAAHIITRLVTKEGWKNTFLGWTAKKGNIKYFVFAAALKPAEGFAGMLLIWKVFMGDMAFSEVFAQDKSALRLAAMLLQLAISVIIFFPAFGEEWGWRGYMMPKLLELMPKPAAIAVGGVLWGLWHSPLTVTGHNFGVDYPGFPWLGILLMCLFCTLTNAILTFVTERTRSIYPASLLHMINNNLSAGILAGIFMSEAALEKLGTEVTQLKLFGVLMAVSVIAGAACFALFVRKPKEAKAEETES